VGNLASEFVVGQGEPRDQVEIREILSDSA
jgi:hypothetical protein